ncbi:putative phage abortive infection protein [Serratia fonticola]|uniref:Uncharacterized protein n=1 Tax=Serratia fonticola TaxID=47917 RepID=A0AAW3WVF9_SERFO|nr:putative phage abortive infection protein [Serratia fonticola]MBC3214771.1 hypothetical protein [Serratia fonticola]NYA15836.1 hypothetical protein [Serratia fonticola]NYA35692.1 hypothetical protein [Serratia fonticola]
MPIVVIFIVGLLLEVLWAFWEWINEHIAIIGTIATTFAFFAMLWSAFETRKSANAAFRAVKTADASLEEARKNFRKEAFNQRFSLLLEQHNVYLEKINKFVGSDQGWAFVEEIFKAKTHPAAFERLRGHFICSPYMRVLYHLLKFINDDYYGSKDDIKGRKKYSSLVRSLISNDVLFLIAVNSSLINENNVINQYDKYQSYLQRFEFFEHADFSLLHHPINKDKPVKDELNLSTVEEDICVKFRRYGISNQRDVFNNYIPSISISVILSYIYKSPNQKETEKWFDNANTMVNNKVELIKRECKTDECMNKIHLGKYINRYMKESLSLDNYPKELEGSELINMSIINGFITSCKNGSMRPLPNPAFYIYSYNEQLKYYAFTGDSNYLIKDINEFLQEIDNRNEFLHGEIYAPVVINVINALQNAKTHMHKQRHTDGRSPG